jgi:sigma-E factor negative regulatory protein RseB
VIGRPHEGGAASGRRRLRTVLVCGVAGAVAVAVALAGDVHRSQRARNDPEAIRLLRTAAGAALRVQYQGTQFLTTWSGSSQATQRVRVEHTPGDGTYFDLDTSVPAGGARSRPGTGASRTYQPDSLPVWNGAVGFTSEILGLLIRNYRVVRGPAAAVCGRKARVVEARRADGSTAGRFWIDTETGLMLHRELMDAGGHAVSTTGFSELRVSGGAGLNEPQTLTTAPSPGATSSAVPWEDRLEGRDLAVLRDRGWPVPGALPGRLTLYDARRPGKAQKPDPHEQAVHAPGPKDRDRDDTDDDIVHLSYSDGLAAVSVFVQRGALDESRFSGWRRTTDGGRTVFRRDSLRHWAVWAKDGYVYTVLTDAPPETTDSVVNALPPDEDALRARMGRGFRRLVSWVNPFG